MNQVNVICPHCGIDVIVEEEVLNDEDVKCTRCKQPLFNKPSVATNKDLSARFTGTLIGMGF